MISRLVRPALLLAATAALGACSTYGGYGGTSVSVGYGSGGYSPYGYSRYGYSPYSYYGWYDGFYYPGAGYYIYDSYGARHRWNDRHRHYWEGRRDGRRHGGENWGGYRRGGDGRYYDGDRRGRDGRDQSRGRDWQRGDRDGGNWQRRDRDGRDGDGRNWQRRDRNGETSRGRDGRQDGNRAGNRQGNPQAAPQRPSRPVISRPRPNATAESPRVSPKEARSGRPSVDRGREFRRGSRD